MSLTDYLELKRLYPEADATTLFELQRKKFLDSIRKRQEAERQAQEYAKVFIASFEKELEKLFK